MSTKFLLAEQVMLRLQGGRPDQAVKTDRRDVMLAIGQAANELIKAQYFSTTLPSGDTIPDGSVLATYDNVAVQAWKNISRAQLPATPIGLPRGMGIFMISLISDPSAVFVPALPGQLAMLKSQSMISGLGGLYAYEQFGSYVEFNKNLIADSITAVMMRLLVTDIATLGVYDPLPLPADYEAIVVETVFKRFLAATSGDMDTDVLTNNMSAR